MKLVVITQNGCNPCTMLKNYVASKEVEFEVANISEDSDKIDEYKVMSTPVAILIDEDGEEITRVNGFNPSNTTDVDVLISQLS